MNEGPRSPCHPERELTGVPEEKYKRCPVCERLWNKGPEGHWNDRIYNFSREIALITCKSSEIFHR